MTKEKLTDSQTSFVKKMSVSIMAFLKKYFNAMPDKEDEENTIKAISNGVSFHGANLWVLVFAIFIASLGLNVNSTAVIIGAMLISPLMGPIIGMGLAVGINDFELLKRSLKNYLVATIISVCTATLYFLLTPLDEAQSELLARTSPHTIRCTYSIMRWCSRHCSPGHKGERKCAARSRNCYSFDAAALHSRLWNSHR